LIEKHRNGRNVRTMCRIYGVSTSGYYAWKQRPISAHRQQDLHLIETIKETHQGLKRSYGAPRLHQELRQNGHDCSVRRVNRLMREIGIKATSTGLYTWRPGRQELHSSAGNQLAAAGEALSPGEQWAGDFTYVRTKAGWLYHAIVMDLYTRKIIGWAFNRARSAELTKSALYMALNRQQPKPGCVFHSDQGIEYAAHDYRDAVEAAGLTRSMSRKGTPLDNAMVESFFHSMKTEVIHGKPIENHIEAVVRIMEYTDFYNRERLHSSLGYQSPENYEKLCA